MMTMPCRITDEQVVNPWEYVSDDEIIDVKSLEELSISDLIGEEMSLWVGKNKEFGYVMEIESERGVLIANKCIHPYAMESLASFCRNFLGYYDRLSTQE